MKIIKNEGLADRLLRVLISEALLLVGYFWLGGLAQTVIVVVGVIILVTGVIGFCGFYKIFAFSTLALTRPKFNKRFWWFFVILFLGILIVGSYFSNFFSKKFFLEDYGKMNNYYKQTLFFTGQDKRTEAVSNYNQLVVEYSGFSSKYSTYHPYVLKADKQFNNDLKKIGSVIDGLSDKINTGDLKNTHLEMEAIRPIFQDILKRNGFSMLAVSLVDFHDVMETVIAAADLKDATGVENAYIEADLKLKAVEAEANDVEIQTIRQKLEEVLSLAKAGQLDKLSDKAAELKSAFVKVYLKRG